MPEPFDFCLGGMQFSLVADQTAGEYRSIKRMADFQKPAAPDITLNVHCGWFPDLNYEYKSFDSNGHVWNGYEIEGKKIIKVSSQNQEYYQLGIFPADFRSTYTTLGS